MGQRLQVSGGLGGRSSRVGCRLGVVDPNHRCPCVERATDRVLCPRFPICVLRAGGVSGLWRRLIHQDA